MRRGARIVEIAVKVLVIVGAIECDSLAGGVNATIIQVKVSLAY